MPKVYVKDESCVPEVHEKKCCLDDNPCLTCINRGKKADWLDNPCFKSPCSTHLEWLKTVFKRTAPNTS